MSQTSTFHYDLLSRALHWATAILVVIAFALGPEHFGRLMRQGLDPATRSDIIWHESLGIVVFVLTLLRLIWTAVRPSAPRFEMPVKMQMAAKLMHLALWGLLFMLPVTAVLTLGSEGHPLTLLGNVRIEKMPFISESGFGHLADWGDMHTFVGDAIMFLAGLHAVAAIYHHVVLKDGVLIAMMPHSNRAN